MSDEKKKKRGIFRYSVLSTSTFSSWRRSSTSGSISQSRTSTSSATTSSAAAPGVGGLLNNINTTSSSSSAAASAVAPSTSSDVPPPPVIVKPPSSAPPRIPIYHRMVPNKCKVRHCDVCKGLFFLDLFRKHHDSLNVYICSVCGVRVHKGCLDRLKNDCKITTEYVGGILENAVINSNKKQWEKPETTPPMTSPACSSATSPAVFEKNVHSNTTPMMTMTASTLDELTIYSDNCDENTEDYETLLMTWEDVTIQLSDVQVKGRIGDGRFGTVHFAEYHGDAAVKFVNMNYLKEEDRRIDVFTQEIVTAYKNSRHDHIALFYGYVADPPTNTYAIVTNFYQHKTLYHRIHESTEDFEQSWTFQISLQICQAMSYLHKKKILHRDLRSKNILLDNANRVVVTDFALMKLERLAIPKREYTLVIPNHWIDYLSPECAGKILLDWRGEVIFEQELPFTEKSDVYSFGTIFFELLLRKMPTGSDSWEQKLYTKMNGHKAPLQRLDSQLQKIDGKLHELLLNCWFYHPEQRPTFTQIVKRITVMMPRKESNKQKRRSTAHENPLF